MLMGVGTPKYTDGRKGREEEEGVGEGGEGGGEERGTERITTS
jgi:hypothetical protein